MKYLFICVASLLGLVSLSACESSFSDMEGGELRERAYLCLIATDQSTAEIQVCKNIQRECKRRQKAGQFDC